jgi:N-formylmaleamate deformylase
MRLLVRILAFSLALLAASSNASWAQTAGASTPAESSKPLKSFAVEVIGNGRPMLLIPGLTCGGDVWKTTVDHFKDRY